MKRLNGPNQVVREAMRLVSKDVRAPRVVREGLVKSIKKYDADKFDWHGDGSECENVLLYEYDQDEEDFYKIKNKPNKRKGKIGKKKIVPDENNHHTFSKS